MAHAGWGLIFRWNPRRFAWEKENSHQPGFARAKPEMETQGKHFDLFAISRFVSSFQRTNHIYSPVIPPLFRRYAAAKIARAERRESEGRTTLEWRVKSEEFKLHLGIGALAVMNSQSSTLVFCLLPLVFWPLPLVFSLLTDFQVTTCDSTSHAVNRVCRL